jgi:polyisoprenoid-binding protein YceI
MKKIAFIIFIFTVHLLDASQDPRIKIYADKGKSFISYSMSHPLHSWTAENKEITSVILTDNERKHIYKVAVSAKISGFDSKNANRDSHMIEASEAIKFPIVSFTSSAIQEEGNILKVKGNLNFHGQSREIFFDAKKEIVNSRLQVSGTFTVKLTDFKIDPPSLMGSAVNDEFRLDFMMVY